MESKLLNLEETLEKHGLRLIDGGYKLIGDKINFVVPIQGYYRIDLESSKIMETQARQFNLDFGQNDRFLKSGLKKCEYSPPFLFYGKDGAQLIFWPSEELAKIYMHYINKVGELEDLNRKSISYFSLTDDSEIILQLNAELEDTPLIMPLAEIINGKTGNNRLFTLPASERADILWKVHCDIFYIGGGYNPTTGYRGEEIDCELYNKFFSDKRRVDKVKAIISG